MLIENSFRRLSHDTIKKELPSSASSLSYLFEKQKIHIRMNIHDSSSDSTVIAVVAS